MDSVKSTANVAGFVQKFTKVLKFRTTGIAPDKSSSSENGSDSTIQSEKKEHQSDNHQKLHTQNFEQRKYNYQKVHSQKLDDKNNRSFHSREAMEALFAKFFASISSLKAAYAQLQIAHTPYDPENIHIADKIVVSELKSLSELKHSYMENRIVGPSYQESQLSAEIIEQKNMIKTYEITVKKFQSQIQIKDSEVFSLREKIQEANQENELLEKRLNQKGFMVLSDDLKLSELNLNHFITVLHFAVRAARNFTKLTIEKMISAGWDLDAAAASIEPHVIYAKPKHKKFAFESFVCQKLFSGFQHETFCLQDEPEEQQQQRHQFFSRFMELKSKETMEFLNNSSGTRFGRFCRSKYLQTVHPKMELSFFGNLNQRNLVDSGGIPATAFYAGFLEMAKWVWLLHCLAFSFDPKILIFQARKGSRFSEVYTECVVRDVVLSDASPDGRPQVGFTVFPGFKVGKTVLQCQVYLSGMKSVEVE